MGKSHDNATFLDDGSSGDLIVNSGHQLQVKRTDGLAFGVIQKGEPNAATGSGIIYNDVNADGHHFKLANTTMLNIDASGRVTMPYQPAFHAGATSTVSYSSGETVVFQTAYHNRGNHYNTSTGVFTAPVAGVYSFTVRMLHQGASNGFQVDSLVSRNDTSSAGYAFLMQRHKYQADYTGFGGYLWEATSGQVFLAANDTLRVKYGGAQGTQIHANPSWSYFCGHLVG